MKKMFIVKACVVAMGIMSSASCFAEDLLIGENATKIIPAGTHKYTRIEIGKDATLIFTGSTQIIGDSLSTYEGAKVLYQSDKFNKTSLFFSLSVLDASGLRELSVIGNGKSSPDIQGRATDGNEGRGAHATSLRYPGGRGADRGGNGKNGAEGKDGESAADVTLNLPGLKSGSRITINTVGGSGGKGQAAGNGGKGGKAAKPQYSFACGGIGGIGGPSGNGGDAGRSFVFLVLDDEDYENRAIQEQVVDTVIIKFNTAPGAGKSGGQGGEHGAAGDGTALIDNSKCNTNIPRSANGADGQNGDGPSSTRPEADWARTDFLAKSAYQQYIVQQIQSLKD